MNYYERHIGDYLKDTAHLSLLEHGIYTRLMDVYYTRESAIPQTEVARLIGARTRDEREALQAVLTEFFVLMDGCWNQKRCEEELMAYRESQGGAEDKKANDKERQRRARERRKGLFEQLRGHGVVPPWDTKTADLQQMLSRVTGGNSSAPVTPPVTRDNTATQTPDTSNQTPEEKPPIAPKGAAEPAGFARFWSTWPSGDRKGGKAKCLELWRRAKLEPDADAIVAHVEAMKGTAKWREDGGAYVPAPQTYLNGRRWDGAELNGHGADELFAGAL